jgi:CheY-like chemotaxis protein
VLVVDDHVEVLQLVTDTLTRIGLQTTTARTGEQALELVAQTQFDLILLDNQMPGMRGLEVCERLKVDRRSWAIPVVFITANGSHAFLAEAQRIGAVAVVCKPFGMEALLRTVLTALKRPPAAGLTLAEILRANAPPPVKPPA